MKQLIIKLNFEEENEIIVDNFVMNLSKLILELYPELKIPENNGLSPWEVIQLNNK
jgi:hypothetical protein